MKNTIKMFAMFVMVAAFAVVASAQSPTITITSPTSADGTAYVASFPYSSSVTFTVEHSVDLTRVNNLNVIITDSLNNSVNLVTDNTNAFNSAGCTTDITSVASSCSVVLGKATITVPWLVANPGNYTITISAKYKSAEGEAIEETALAMLAVEHPAPPAVANAYLNTFPKSSISGKKRGCVISQIANNHAKDEKYNAKGGPYNLGLIRMDVDAYLDGC